MFQNNSEASGIEELYKLKPVHFADLIRAAQLVYDPGKGVTGVEPKIDWNEFGIPDNVAENLELLGKEFQYSSPHAPVDQIWQKLTPETRVWFVENKERLWLIEESFPALDED
ncbi:MAG: hypothetical protein WBF90_30330 [Rivularia sp. (in: cyanobacteria)]|jgi:hypothetical protein